MTCPIPAFCFSQTPMNCCELHQNEWIHGGSSALKHCFMKQLRLVMSFSSSALLCPSLMPSRLPGNEQKPLLKIKTMTRKQALLQIMRKWAFPLLAHNAAEIAAKPPPSAMLVNTARHNYIAPILHLHSIALFISPDPLAGK